MGDTTKIEWADHSASPWYGCANATYTDADGNEHGHPGCGRCYAETMAKRNPATLGVWGTDGTRVRSASFWDNCRRWNKQAEKAGVVASVFPSICDPFEDWQGPILDSKGEVLYDDGEGGYTEAQFSYGDIPRPGQSPISLESLRRDLFRMIDECQSLRFLLLTKRPENVRRTWPKAPHMSNPDSKGKRLNVWLLTSISDQPTADAMIPLLLACRDLVPVLGVSAEPLLGPVDLEAFLPHPEGGSDGGDESIDWAIVGGESGHGARKCCTDWIRSIVEQCKAAEVACFVKQLGSAPMFNEAEIWADMADKRYDRKGGDIDEFPADLRVREFPAC